MLDFDDGSDEFFKEARLLEEAREEVVEEINKEALDMRAVMVLICHDHNTAVTQT